MGSWPVWPITGQLMRMGRLENGKDSPKRDKNRCALLRIWNAHQMKWNHSSTVDTRAQLVKWWGSLHEAPCSVFPTTQITQGMGRLKIERSEAQGHPHLHNGLEAHLRRACLYKVSGCRAQFSRGTLKLNAQIKTLLGPSKQNISRVLFGSSGFAGPVCRTRPRGTWNHMNATHSHAWCDRSWL